MNNIQRTTVRLDPHLLSEAKKRAAQAHQTLTALIEEALRQLLYPPPPTKNKKWIKLSASGKGGLQPGVDLDNSAALRDLMDEKL